MACQGSEARIIHNNSVITLAIVEVWGKEPLAERVNKMSREIGIRENMKTKTGK